MRPSLDMLILWALHEFCGFAVRTSHAPVPGVSPAHRCAFPVTPRLARPRLFGAPGWKASGVGLLCAGPGRFGSDVCIWGTPEERLSCKLPSSQTAQGTLNKNASPLLFSHYGCHQQMLKSVSFCENCGVGGHGWQLLSYHSHLRSLASHQGGPGCA